MHETGVRQCGGEFILAFRGDLRTHHDVDARHRHRPRQAIDSVSPAAADVPTQDAEGVGEQRALDHPGAQVIPG
jgi:hypothetical protein